mgnify:CR=1 FL=1
MRGYRSTVKIGQLHTGLSHQQNAILLQHNRLHTTCCVNHLGIPHVNTVTQTWICARSLRKVSWSFLCHPPVAPPLASTHAWIHTDSKAGEHKDPSSADNDANVKRTTNSRDSQSGSFEYLQRCYLFLEAFDSPLELRGDWRGLQLISIARLLCSHLSPVGRRIANLTVLLIIHFMICWSGC